MTHLLAMPDIDPPEQRSRGVSPAKTIRYAQPQKSPSPHAVSQLTNSAAF
ncbi:hypothetical protein [Leisingera methylohalidivorans]|nr:hypothetical protein [Leisingera methylohalidivorans]